jgi:hypothetical protein
MPYLGANAFTDSVAGRFNLHTVVGQVVVDASINVKVIHRVHAIHSSTP